MKKIVMCFCCVLIIGGILIGNNPKVQDVPVVEERRSIFISYICIDVRKIISVCF